MKSGEKNLWKKQKQWDKRAKKNVKQGAKLQSAILPLFIGLRIVYKKQ